MSDVCKTCGGMFSILDPLSEDDNTGGEGTEQEEPIKKYVACPSCNRTSSELDELKCPYCLTPQDPDSWRCDVPRAAATWEGQARTRAFQCGYCQRTFGWQYEAALVIHTWQVDSPEVDPSRPTVTDERQNFLRKVQKDALEEKYPTYAEKEAARSLLLGSSAALLSRWGMAIPLPITDRGMAKTREAAERNGWTRESMSLADRFRSLLGPCLVLTSKSDEASWLRLLNNQGVDSDNLSTSPAVDVPQASSQALPVYLWLDDERPCPEGWTACRWPSEVIKHLELAAREGRPATMSLDHDLGEVGETAPTGYDVLTWLEEHIYLNPSFPLPTQIHIHTANAAARTRMEAARAAIYRQREVL